MHRLARRGPASGDLERNPRRDFNERCHVDDVVVRNEADIMHVVQPFNKAPLFTV